MIDYGLRDGRQEDSYKATSLSIIQVSNFWLPIRILLIMLWTPHLKAVLLEDDGVF